MTKEEKQQKAFQLYAALGELSVLRKQTVQRLDAIDSQVDGFEQQLAELAKIVPEEKSEIKAVEDEKVEE